MSGGNWEHDDYQTRLNLGNINTAPFNYDDSPPRHHGGSRTSRLDNRALQRHGHDGSHTSRPIRPARFRRGPTQHVEDDVQETQGDGTRDLLGRFQRQRSIVNDESFEDVQERPGRVRGRRHRESSQRRQDDDEQGPVTGQYSHGHVHDHNSHQYDYGQGSHQFEYGSGSGSAAEVHVDPLLYGGIPHSYDYSDSGHLSGAMDHLSAVYAQTMSLGSSSQAPLAFQHQQTPSAQHDVPDTYIAAQPTLPQIINVPPIGEQEFCPMPQQEEDYEYVLQVKDASGLAGYADVLVYGYLNNTQTLLITDRIRQIRPFHSDTIRVKLRGMMNGPLAVDLLSDDRDTMEAAVDRVYGLHTRKRGTRYSWMDGFNNEKRRRVIEVFADATDTPPDRLLDAFLRWEVTPDVAQHILDLPNSEAVLRFAEENDMILPKWAGHMPYKKGLSFVQRQALLQRIQFATGNTIEYVRERLGTPFLPAGWGKAMLKANDVNFRYVLNIAFGRPNEVPYQDALRGQ
ncbi:hypothetical protein CBS101457_000117 [Exobasidium rhododendri]|nr:hypothetical protein CBS101457_000117 [Exobasidium rhododendri]